MVLVATAARCLVVYALLLVSLRLAGKRAIQQSTAPDFVLALVIGDMVDDAILGDVSLETFTLATIVLLLARLCLASLVLQADAADHTPSRQ